MLKLRSGKELIELPNKKRKRKLLRQKESSTKKPANYLQRNPQKPEVVSKPQRKTELSKRRRTWSLSTNEKKLLELKYTKGPTAYGSIKNLQKSTKLKPSKVKLFLEGKNAHTKHKKYRKRFPTLKVIAYDINEIWSLDLAYVDKLAKENKDVKYLLVAVDCLSRYLRVEPLKSKYATTTADAFKKMIKNKQPKKVWVDAGTEFKGSFSTLCQKNDIEVYKTFSEKKSAFAERNIRSLKNLIYKYLEDKWTYSYFNQLQSFVQTINSRVNRVTKLAPNKVTKKDVPYLISLIFNDSSKLVRRPKFYVGDFVRISKADFPFRKGYKQTFTNEVFEIYDIPTTNPPTYSLIGASQEPVKGKFYELELVKVRDSSSEITKHE